MWYELKKKTLKMSNEYLIRETFENNNNDNKSFPKVIFLSTQTAT